MTARIIDGKVIAAELRARVAEEVARVKREHQLTPGLAVVLVGNDPASEVYVRSKQRRRRPPAWPRSSTSCPPMSRRPSCWR